MGELEMIINHKKEQVMKSEILDYGCLNGNDFRELYKMIDQEAANLKDSGRYDYKFKSQPRGEIVKENARRKIYSIHKAYKGRRWYDRLVAPGLKRFTRKWLQPTVTLDLVSMMELDNEGFIVELYRKVFNREPDDVGLKNNVQLLDGGQLTRLEMINAFCDSNERIKPVRVKGKLRAKFAHGER